MNRWCRLGGLAGGVLLLCMLPAMADDPEKAAETFRSLYGADLARVRESSENRDDVELAGRLLETAKKSTDQPAFLAILCQTAADLAMIHPVGFAKAAEALELLAGQVPDKAAACRERLLEVRQRQFDTARGDEREAAGEALLDLLAPIIQAKEAAGDVAEASALYRRAKTIARAARSPRTADIDARAEALAQRTRAERQIADVRAVLEKDPANVSVREGLVRLLLVDRDAPVEAAKVLAGCRDKDLLKYVPAAARPVEAAPELACLELGEWYARLAEAAPPHAKTAMYARARPYLERFLEVHVATDLMRTRGQVALGKVTEAAARLAAPPPKPAPREKPAKPAPSQPAVIKPGPWVDLLALVDPAKDAVSGTWRRVGPALVLVDPAQEARIGFPVVPEGSYELLGEFVRTSGDDTIAIILPVGSRQVGLMLGHVHGKASGLDMLYGKVPADNETAVKPAKFDNNRVYGVRVRVLLQQEVAHIAVHVDAKPYIEWRGPVSALSLGTTWSLGQHGGLGLGVSNSTVTWRSVRLRMLSGEARPLRAADVKAAPLPAPAVVKPGQWADLLALVDPDRDAVAGSWKREDDALVLNGCDGARLAIPCEIEGDYLLRVEFNRVRGGSEVAFILPVGPHATALLLSKQGNECSGLYWAKDAARMVTPAPLANDTPHVLEVAVRAARDPATIEVRLDGHPYFTWQGPAGSATVWDPFRLPNAKCMGLGSWNAMKVVFKSVKVRMLSGTARPLRPPG